MVQNFKNKIKNLTLWDRIIILSPFLIVLYYKISVVLHLPSLCLYKLITGHDCIGCGLTRAFISLLHFDIKTALEYNKLIVIVFPLVLYIWIKFIYQKFHNIK